VTKSSDYGQTDRVYHHIDTGEARLFRQPPRKLLLAKQADMGKIPKDMPRHGIIEGSNSPCSSLVLVQKKNLDLCFYVDYRKLNGITKKKKLSHYPGLMTHWTCLLEPDGSPPWI
jgi:hypothetical protein